MLTDDELVALYHEAAGTDAAYVSPIALRFGRMVAAAERERLSALIPDEALRMAVERTRDDLGPNGTNYPAVRKLLAFAERAIESGRA